MLPVPDAAYGAGLFGLALFLWLRDGAWMSAPADALPVLLALPLFFVLCRLPWRNLSGGPLSSHRLSAGVALFVTGVALDATVVLAAAWTLLLAAWVEARAPDRWPSARPLLVLPFLAFPWLAAEGAAIGWAFRLTAAIAAEVLFAGLGMDVTREGTRLVVAGIPVEVSAACSGLNDLQAMLIVGAVPACRHLGPSRFLRTGLPVLVGAAWASNTARVVVLAAAALLAGPAFAQGAFHQWGGLAVLSLMFAGCSLAFERMSGPAPPGPEPSRREP